MHTGTQFYSGNCFPTLKPIDIFKLTDETTGVVSCNFSYAAVAPGMTVLNFVLIETSVPGDVFKDGASFAIQVDDDDAAAAPIAASTGFSSQPPASSL